MIEFVRWPQNQTEIGPDSPFYLELYGEASPEVDERYVEVLSLAEEQQGLQEGARLAPLYEYCWSFGYIDHYLDNERKRETEGWGNLADPGAEVWLYFPTAGGWRIQELVATVKYLSPAREHASLLAEAGHLFSTAQPIIEDASKLAQSMAWAPGLGMAATGTSKLLDMIAKLRITSVPQAHGYHWFVEKVSSHVDQSLVQGIKWILPKKMMMELGSRITGSVALSIVPAVLQASIDKDQARTGKNGITLERFPVTARAAIYQHPSIVGQVVRQDLMVHLPKGPEELQLWIQPREPIRRQTARKQPAPRHVARPRRRPVRPHMKGAGS